MKQIIVPVPNSPGTLAAITESLAAAGVNIESIDAEAIEANGVIILRVDHYDDALRSLRDAGFRAVTEDALVLRLENRPGALAAIARRLTDSQIAIRSLQILERCGPTSLVTLVIDDPSAAKSLLADVLVEP